MPSKIIGYRNVQTSLSFWDPTKPKPALSDYTKPGFIDQIAKNQSSHQASDVIVHDARGMEDDLTLERNGFCYIKHKVDGLDDCKTEDEVFKLLLPITEDLVRKMYGADKVITYLHRVRNEPSDPDKAIPKRNAPFEFVHADQTPAGGKAICDGIIAEHFTEEEKLHKTRKVLVNAWRPLKTIRRDPLAVLDWTSLDLESDLIPCPRINADSTWGEMAKFLYRPRHRWYYLNAQEPDELLLFLQYDSAGPNGPMTIPHTAFKDTAFNNEPPRCSVEIKVAAFVNID